MFWAAGHQSMSTYSQPFFQFHLEERWGMDVQGVISPELKMEVMLLLSANSKSYMPRRLIDLCCLLSTCN